MDVNMTTSVPDSPSATLTRANLSLAYILGKLGILSVMALVIITGNALTIAAVIRTRKLRQSPTNIFVLSLAIADEMVGLLLALFLIMPFLVKTETALRVSVCLARAPYYSTITTSTWTLFAIAVDRYLAIVHPLSYKRRMTITRARIISCLIWLCQIIIIGGTTCYYGNVAPIERVATGDMRDLIPDDAFNWAIVIQVYLPIIGNIILYSCIFVSIWKRKKVSTTTSVNTIDGGNSSRKLNHEKMMMAVTKMMCVVLGYLIFAWTPYLSLIYLYSHEDTYPLWYVYTVDSSKVLLFSNSAINPIIYSWFNRDFKEAYNRVLRCQKASSAPLGSVKDIITDQSVA